MPLAGYTPESRVVELSRGQSFNVTGLSLNHMTVLVREHFPDLDAIFDLFQNVETMNRADFEPLALSIISNAPGFAANVIALAAGEGSAEDAERLPAPIQLRALLDIGELTFAEVGGVGKALEMVTSLLRKSGAKEALSKLSVGTTG